MPRQQISYTRCHLHRNPLNPLAMLSLSLSVFLALLKRLTARQTTEMRLGAKKVRIAKFEICFFFEHFMKIQIDKYIFDMGFCRSRLAINSSSAGAYHFSYVFIIILEASTIRKRLTEFIDN